MINRAYAPTNQKIVSSRHAIQALSPVIEKFTGGMRMGRLGTWIRVSAYLLFLFPQERRLLDRPHPSRDHFLPVGTRRLRNHHHRAYFTGRHWHRFQDHHTHHGLPLRKHRRQDCPCLDHPLWRHPLQGRPRRDHSQALLWHQPQDGQNHTRHHHTLQRRQDRPRHDSFRRQRLQDHPHIPSPMEKTQYTSHHWQSSP